MKECKRNFKASQIIKKKIQSANFGNKDLKFLKKKKKEEKEAGYVAPLLTLTTLERYLTGTIGHRGADTWVGFER